MLVSTRENKKCQFCGIELVGDLEQFSPVPRRNPSVSLRWCVCSACKVKFINNVRANSKTIKNQNPASSVTFVKSKG